MDENQESEEENEHQEPPEESEESGLDESECDATIADLLDEIDRLIAENEQLRADLATHAGRLDELERTRHEHAPAGQHEQQREQLPEPEPVPEERHFWFRRIGGSKA